MKCHKEKARPWLYWRNIHQLFSELIGESVDKCKSVICLHEICLKLWSGNVHIYLYLYIASGSVHHIRAKTNEETPDKNAWEIRKKILKQTAACLCKSIHVDLYLISYTWGLFASQSRYHHNLFYVFFDACRSIHLCRQLFSSVTYWKCYFW